MIIVTLVGGLGNQLWGYGLGRSLGRTQEVQYNISNFGLVTHRQYGLDKLGLSLPLTKETKGRWINEKGMGFDPEILNITGDATLFGYWQNLNYIEPVKSRILSEVFVGMALSEKAKEYEKKILSGGSNSVFIHVRRSDYLREPHASFHGNLGSCYYSEAIFRFEKEGDIQKFFVFSDDIEWCQENFPSDFNFIMVKGNTEAEDLYLMAQCSNGIIANSSFSWWGAFLGADQKGGQIIAPKNWFQNKDVDGSQIVPERWIKI